MQTHTKSLALVGLLLACPAALSAQVGGVVPREARASQETRQECQQAAADLLAGPSAAAADDRVKALLYCELSAPPALAAAWRNPVVRSNALIRLVSASWRNQDRRILEAVLPIVQDEGAGLDLRLAGVSVLASYLVPQLHVNPSHWYPSPEQEWPNIVGVVHHGFWAVGPEPLTEDSSERIVEALNGVLETSEDLRLKRVIEQILQRWELWKKREAGVDDEPVL